MSTGPGQILSWKQAALKRAAALVLIAAVLAGWRAFFFLCDDAYIAFRYVSNSMLGYGFTWNPPPFLPVEGYTSFLWVIMLRVVWSLTGMEPPVASNLLSLLFGFGTLYLAYRFLARMMLSRRLERYRGLLTFLALLAVVSNRTWLAWLSSGLETSLFNFCLIWWLYCAFTDSGRRDGKWAVSLSVSASLAALARPDGLLAVMATAIIAVVEYARGNRLPGHWLRFTPLLLVPAHVLWRISAYGNPLPNTYYAKHAGAWPESGIRYLASFAVEYGLWVWLLLVGLCLAAHIRKGGLPAGPRLRENASPLLAVAAVLAHMIYYTFFIGGDHFEYRVYSHLIPLAFVSAVWLLDRASFRPAAALASLALFILSSYPVPWVHWLETRDLNTRAETHRMVRPIAHRFPGPAVPLVNRWDRWQAWLIDHFVCVRHQEHKVHLLWLKEEVYPSRETGRSVTWQDRTVAAAGAVGYLGWVFPEAAIIDTWGLNDRVIARSPLAEGTGPGRQMAHDRVPPAGYVQCFRPNLGISGDYRLRIVTRPQPLTDEEIRACEERDWLAGG